MDQRRHYCITRAGRSDHNPLPLQVSQRLHPCPHHLQVRPERQTLTSFATRPSFWYPTTWSDDKSGHEFSTSARGPAAAGRREDPGGSSDDLRLARDCRSESGAYDAGGPCRTARLHIGALESGSNLRLFRILKYSPVHSPAFNAGGSALPPHVNAERPGGCEAPDTQDPRVGSLPAA